MTDKEKQLKRIKRNFNRCTQIAARRRAVEQFIGIAFNDIVNPNNGKAENLLTIIEDSKFFTKKPIVRQDDPTIDWSLDDDWFLSLIAQVTRYNDPAPVRKLFKVYNWDYPAALNPKSDNFSTVETFILLDDNQHTELNLLLQSRAALKIGTVVKSKEGYTYDIVSHKGNVFELVGERQTFFRDLAQLRKNFTIEEQGV